MNWFAKCFGPGTSDDKRNPFWRLTEALRIRVRWSRTLINLRCGFKRGERWVPFDLEIGTAVEQNFYNGIFTLNIYLVACKWMIFPRINVVFRFSRNYWFQAGIGILFDRGEFGAKLVIQNWENEEKFNPNCNAIGWNEGSV